VNEQMRHKVESSQGFIAALDQSGGSTPKALRLYGIDADAYSSDEQMFDLMHQMRTRIITSPAFTGDHILGAILFEMTMDRLIEGMGSAEYLWNEKSVVPFLKVDKGLAEAHHGVQLMKPIPNLDELLDRARTHGVFGTKMRSVIAEADSLGVDEIVAQQFAVGTQILAAGLVPILEPEVDIHSPTKAQAEELLKTAIQRRLDALPEQHQVMLKLTLPSQDGFYSDLIAHPRVLRVVALSGGYTREDANALLARNPGLIASFSRALTEGLTAQQTDDEFSGTLRASIDSIYAASIS